MIKLSQEASEQLDALRSFYRQRHRAKAILNLAHSLAEASLIIANAPEQGLPAPRPYPDLASLRLLWLKRGRYWIAYARDQPKIIGIFFETDDVPNKVR